MRIHVAAWIVIAVSGSLLAGATAKPKKPIADAATALQTVNDRSDTAVLETGSAGPAVLRAQILLDRARFSPGEIDGKFGPTLAIAVEGFRKNRGLPTGAAIDADVWRLLNEDSREVLATYTITAEDLKEPLVAVPKDILAQAKLERLGFVTAAERLAERLHLSPKLLAELNPDVAFDTVGGRIIAPRVERAEPGAAGKIIVSESKKTVTAVNAEGAIVAQYPAVLGGAHDPLPIGSWKVTVIEPYPVFHYDPKRFWNAPKEHPKAKLAPGPNNPAGVVWIGLSKEHYGIHGSPEPGQIGKTESHGCIRLTNWDAADLAGMVKAGTPVLLEE